MKDKKQKYVTYEYDIKADVKIKFEEKYKELLGKEYEDFIKYSLTFPLKSIRLNNLKKDPEYLLKRLKKNFTLKKIPWTKYGYWISHNERRDIGNTIEHSLGYIYIQEAASMLPVNVLGNDLKKNGIVLDMCAAPGSKTTQLAQHMDNQGLIVANEMLGKRIAALGINIQQNGSHNTIITQHDATKLLRRWNFKFDNILLDAPCSGTGTTRKSPSTFRTWNPSLGIAMAKIQRKMIATAFELLKDGGVMTYSTCSIEPEENESVVDWLLRKYDNAKIMDINLDINKAKPILKYNDNTFHPDIKKTLRIYPHHNNTDGFFIAKIKKV